MSLLGNHTPTFAQDRSTFSLKDTVPIVPPLPHIALNGNSFRNVTYAMDGLECHDCTFQDVTLTYGGGAYLLENPKVSLPVRLNLTGAALNTAQLLQVFGLIGCPAKAAPPMAPTPNILTAKYAPSGHLESPVGVK
jgi:hypothetical protein